MSRRQNQATAENHHTSPPSRAHYARENGEVELKAVTAAAPGSRGAGRAERQRPRIAARALRFREWAVSGRAGAGNTRYRHVLRTRRETRQSSRRMLR